MTSRRAGASAVALTVLAVGLMLLMIMFAARVGPQRIIHGPLVDPSFRPVQPSYSMRTLGGNPHAFHDVANAHPSTFIRILALLIRLALAALALWAIGWFVRWVWRVLAVRRRAARAEHVDFDVLDDPEPLAEEMRQDAVDQLALLLGGSPRNAIVACWDRFEEQAERVHIARKDWETSSEFTLRLLDQVAADPAAVSRLEGLYREARFSAHEIDEARREAAVEALHAIHLSLGVGSVTG